MKPRNYIILILTITLLGCQEEKKTSLNPSEQVSVPATNNDNNSKTLVEVVEPKTESKPQQNDNSLKIRFEEFIIEIDSIGVWDEDGKLTQLQKDTARIFLELGETIEGRTFQIQQIEKGDIQIYQRFENSVTVMNEGPHCDLTEWKHYNSDWEQLKIENEQFVTTSYSEADLEKFIKVDMLELQEAVKKQCGDEWAKHVNDVTSPNEYPCGVSTSRIFLKIEFNGQDSMDLKKRIISFEIPMGC